MIVDGGIRDTQRIYEMDDFNAFIRGVDPSAINNVSMPEINGVTRIGEATCITSPKCQEVFSIGNNKLCEDGIPSFSNTLC